FDRTPERIKPVRTALAQYALARGDARAVYCSVERTEFFSCDGNGLRDLGLVRYIGRREARVRAHLACQVCGRVQPVVRDNDIGSACDEATRCRRTQARCSARHEEGAALDLHVSRKLSEAANLFLDFSLRDCPARP